MSLQVWLPLTIDVRQQGLSGVTMSGSPASWTDGKLGKAATWSGNVANCVYNNTSDFNYTNNFSVAVWYKHKFTSGATQYAFTIGRADAGGYGYGLQPTAATQVYFRFGNAVYPINNLVQDTWYHLVMTVGNNKVIIYKDGAQVSSNNMPGTLPTYSDGNGLGLGCFHYGSNIYPFYGSLNDFRIYDHCLSPIEVKELSNGLILHYPLSDKYIESTENWLESRSTSMTGWSSYGFGTHATITTTSEIEPAIAGAEVALVTQKTSNVTNTACEIATPVYTATTKTTIQNKGEKFTFSAYIKGKGTTIGKQVQIHIYNTNGTNTISKGDSSFRLTSEWQRISYTHEWTYDTPSTNSLNVYVVGYISTGESFYMSNPQVEKKDHITPWTELSRDMQTIYDCSGFCNNGTRTGTFSWTSDAPKYEVSTTASGGASTYLIGPVLPAEAKTVALWVKCKKTQNAAIFNDKTSGLQIGLLNSLLYMNSKTSTPGFTTTHWVDDEWNHVVVTYDGTTRKAYINGQAETQSGASNYYIHNADNCWLWNRSYNNNYPFNGSLSDLRVYTTVLSADDVKSLYQNEAQVDASGNVLGPIR